MWLPKCASIRTVEESLEVALYFRVVYTDWSTEHGYNGYQRECVNTPPSFDTI